MDRRQIEELLPFYALDALNEEERQLVEAYLREHPEARAELEEMEKAAAALPYGVARAEPSPRAKEALMRRVAADQRATSSVPTPSSRPRARRWGNFLQAFSLGAAALAILWAIVLSAKVTRLQNEVAALNDTVAGQENRIEEINTTLSQLTPSTVITVSLKGTDVEPQAQGQLIASPDSQSGVLAVARLTPLEVGKTYQVWLIRGGKPVSAGLLTVDEEGQGVLVISSEEEIGSFDALGISIEPKKGSLQPTGEIVVLSEF